MSLNPLKNRRIAREGTAGTAVVVAFDDETMRRRTDDGESFNLPLELEIHVDGRAPWRTRGEFCVPSGHLHAPGQRVACKVGRTEADVVLDWAA